MTTPADSMSLNQDMLVLTLGGNVMKTKLPRGEQGPAGRDGMNIRGDVGPVGVKGDNGRDGRDSVVPGPKGDKGDCGNRGPPIKLAIGSVSSGETANAILSQQMDDYVLHLTLPKGATGNQGISGRDGKHGSHEIVNVASIGHNPRFTEEIINKHVIADGIIDLPSMTEADIGKWIMFKTFDRLVANNCVEGFCAIEKNNSAKLIVVPYQSKFLFTRF